jgi:RNA polymerase sigma-70 factor, ECF subfamily
MSQKPDIQAGTPAQAAEPFAPPQEWVDRYGDLLYRWAFMRTGDPALAQELVQETFLAALKSRATFQGQSKPSTWLLGILKHKLLDGMKRSARAQNFSDLPDPVVESIFNRMGAWKKTPASWSADPEQLAQNSEFHHALQACLEALPPPQRQAFLLRIMDSQDANETCKLLRITATNLWVTLHRARLRLRECLMRKGIGPDVS